MAAVNKVGEFYSKDDDFWTKYNSVRPYLPDSLFERITSYHSQHGGSFKAVHDTGAGAGIQSARIGKHFDKVVVTDPSEENIRTAKGHLRDAKYEFHAAKLEDTANIFPQASLDMVFGATMLHYADVPRALEAVAHQLKSGGTLALFFSGLPELDDDADADVAAAIHNLIHTGGRRIRQLYGAATLPGALHVACGFQDIGLPPDVFEPNSQRWFFNFRGDARAGDTSTYRMMIAPEWRDEYPFVSHVGPQEQVVQEVDEDLAFIKDRPAMREWILTQPFDFETPEMKEALKRVEDTIGDRKIKGHWAASLILATRK